MKGKVVRFGKNVPEEKSGVSFVSNDGLEGTRFAIDGVEARLKLPGIYNYTNALACVAVAKTLGLDAERIRAGIESVKSVGGRSSAITINTKKNSKGESKKVMLMYDCYNANPDSMEKALNLCGSLEIKGRMMFII